MLMRQKKIPSKLETFGPEKYKRTLLGYFESETARILQSGEFGKGVFERTINDMGRHAKEGSAGPDFLKEAALRNAFSILAEKLRAKYSVHGSGSPDIPINDFAFHSEGIESFLKALRRDHELGFPAIKKVAEQTAERILYLEKTRRGA